MYRYTILIISFLLVILFYTIPVYAGIQGACCFQDGSCGDDIFDVACESEGGIHQGPGTRCSGVECPPPEPDELGCCEGVRGNPCVDGLDPTDPATNQERCENNGGAWSLGEVCDNNNECNAPVNPDHLMCYQVKDPLQLPKERDPKTIFVSVPQFGSEVRCVLKGRSRLFCAPACKAKQGDPPVGAGLCQPDPENPLGFDRVCYNVENCGEISGQIDELAVGVTDQFDDISISTEGPRLFTNFNPHQICTPALKCTGGCEDLYPRDLCGRGGYCDINCQCVVPVCGNGIIERPFEECEVNEDCIFPDVDDIGPTVESVCLGCQCVTPR